MSGTLPRREFLKAATLGLAAGVPASVAAGGAGLQGRRSFTMDLACGVIGVQVPLPEAVALAHRFGFEAVDPDAGFLAKQEAEQVEKLRDDLKARGLAWGAASLPVDFRGDDARFQADLKGLPAVAVALRRAGVTRVGTWLSPAHRTLTYLANFKQHASRLRDVAGILDGQGLRLGLEYVGPKTSWTSARHPFVHTMAEMKELIAAIDRANIGLVLDSWHWYTAGEGEAELLSLSNRDVVACDLNDAPAGVAVDRQRDSVRDLPCATGVIDLKTFLGALVKIGYDGPVRAEPFKAELRKLPREEAVKATAEAMKRAFALVS
jgi:sugar phosphate isomerase/epimerase